MNAALVRIRSIEIKNIKNTVYGMLDMPAQAKSFRPSLDSEVLGIYGQNGSGKTAVIDGLFFIQKILMGYSLPDEIASYIREGQEFAELNVEFTVECGDRSFETGYHIQLRRTGERHAELCRETLSAAKIINGKRTNKLIFMEYSNEPEAALFTPKTRLEEVVSGKRENRTNLIVAKKIARINRCSYIFGETSREIFLKESGEKFEDYAFIIQSLYQYAMMDLFVIRNSHSGAISANVLLPVAFRFADHGMTAKGDLVFTLKEPTVIEDSSFDMLRKVVSEINIVLQTLVPGLILGIRDYGQQLMEHGGIGRRVDLTSKRGDTEIAIRYESAGIIKIISILNVLIRAYNDPGICLAVDELDSGVYEYLLGELLDIFNKGAKGQLIFTSHNLRALEMLDKDSILFSTANPENRYMRLQNIKNTNNLRDVYIRCITLGGQKESVYSETDSIKIARAFRKAGREIGNAGEREESDDLYRRRTE